MKRILTLLVLMNACAVNCMEYTETENTQKQKRKNTESTPKSKKQKGSTVYSFISSAASFFYSPKREREEEQSTSDTKKQKKISNEVENNKRKTETQLFEQDDAPIELKPQLLTFILQQVNIECTTQQNQWEKFYMLRTDNFIISSQGTIFDLQTKKPLYKIPATDLLCNVNQLLVFSPSQNKVWDIGRLQYIYTYLVTYLNYEQKAVLNFIYLHGIEQGLKVQLNDYQRGIIQSLDPDIFNIISPYFS